MNKLFKSSKKGQSGVDFAVSVSVGIILLIVLILGVAYGFAKTNASPTALNITASDPEYTLVRYIPLFIVLIVFLGIISYLYVRGKR